MSGALLERRQEADPLPGLIRTFMDSFGRRHKQCDDARFLLAEVPLHADAARRVLPLGMWLTDPPTGTLFVVDYRGPTFTVPYREAALMVHVRTLAGRGWHCCWMVLDDDDTAMIYGRELLGYPKKRARIAFEESGDEVRVSVTRRGTEVFAMDAVRGAPQVRPAPVFDVKTFNVGGMGQFLAFNPMWCFRITETIREAYGATAALRVGRSEADPLAPLVAGQPRTARFVATDITGARYLFPLGVAGPRWFANTYRMRFR